MKSPSLRNDGRPLPIRKPPGRMTVLCGCCGNHGRGSAEAKEPNSLPFAQCHAVCDSPADPPQLSVHVSSSAFCKDPALAMLAGAASNQARKRFIYLTLYRVLAASTVIGFSFGTGIRWRPSRALDDKGIRSRTDATVSATVVGGMSDHLATGPAGFAKYALNCVFAAGFWSVDWPVMHLDNSIGRINRTRA